MGLFNNYMTLTEQTAETADKHAVFMIGRMQPPTRGHQKAISKTLEIARVIEAESYVFTTQSHDKEGRNPLAWSIKNQFLKKMIPETPLIEDSSIRQAWDVIRWLKERNYTHVYLVAGSDRVEEYTNRWLPYAKSCFKEATVVNAGMRDPDEESVNGMSGTKARNAALQRDLGSFRVATGWDGEISRELMDAIREGHGEN